SSHQLLSTVFKRLPRTLLANRQAQVVTGPSKPMSERNSVKRASALPPKSLIRTKRIKTGRAR
ncbi:hypothetical protein FS837_002543, partial [Tulasnella sp. UAMH 9824]